LEVDGLYRDLPLPERPAASDRGMGDAAVQP